MGAPNYIPLTTLGGAALADLEGAAATRATHLREARHGLGPTGATFHVSRIRPLLAV